MTRPTRRFALIIILTLALAAGACTSQPKPGTIVRQSDAYIDWGKQPPQAKDRAKHDITGKRPFEWWYFDGHLDDGRTFVGVFLDPDFTSGRPGATFSLYEPDWTKVSRFKRLEPEEMKTSTQDVGVETPYGFARRLDDKTYHVRWAIDDTIADLRLTEEAPGWLPGGEDGVNSEAVDFFWAVHQGRNRVEGTITHQGRTSRVSGVGYADHNWGRKPLSDIVRNWIWGRIIAGDYTIIYADVDYIDPAVRSRPLYIAQGDKMIVGAGSPKITQADFAEDKGLKRYYPRDVRIEFDQDGVKADLRIRFTRLVESVDLLTVSGLGSFSQWFVRTFVARPTYFRVIAEFSGTIEHDGQKDDLQGECLYEVMGFE